MELSINIDVPDIDQAVAFYTAALDLTPGRRLFDGSVLEMFGASSKIYLLAKAPGSTASPAAALVRDYRRHWTPVHLDFIVGDVGAAVERALAAGATLEGEIQAFRWGRVAVISDPFGHGFCFLQFVGKGYDEVAGL